MLAALQTVPGWEKKKVPKDFQVSQRYGIRYNTKHKDGWYLLGGVAEALSDGGHDEGQ